MSWNQDRARDLYRIPHWGGGYFDVGDEGRFVVRPRRDADAPTIDFVELVREIERGGQSLPVLVRFLDVLHDRVDHLCSAFRQARESDGYTGQHLPVYPIKVNQQGSVVRELIEFGDGRVGLEAGSKPELLAVLALVKPGGLVVCNGYKDREFIRLALIGRQMGLRVHIVVERMTELDLVLEESAKLGIAPLLGFRVRLASIGAGNWQNTGGEKSKFGLSPVRALAAVERLREAGMLEHLKLLHVHLGSQIANIRDIHKGMREVARTFAELRRLEVPISVVDVGGGLGIDYEGTRSRSYCSLNYSWEEYANVVTHTLWEICEEQGLEHPDIVTEAGRAFTAHHAVLVTDVIDVDGPPAPVEVLAPAADAHLLLHDLWKVLTELDDRPPLESYHDAVHWHSEVLSLYIHGVLDLEQRAWADGVYYAICRRVYPHLNPGSPTHREAFDDLTWKLADKYFCNFSVFQSTPDVWAIRQIFPITPLQRLDEAPERRGTLQDLTCDSDGRIDNYVQGDGVESTLPLHDLADGERYLLGIFLVGAYQEILGDLHNLFGDAASINVRLTETGHELSAPQQGDTVTDVLRQVGIRAEDLLQSYRSRIEAADLDADTRRAHLAELQAGLLGYTYLED